VTDDNTNSPFSLAAAIRPARPRTAGKATQTSTISYLSFPQRLGSTTREQRRNVFLVVPLSLFLSSTKQAGIKTIVVDKAPYYYYYDCLLLLLLLLLCVAPFCLISSLVGPPTRRHQSQYIQMISHNISATKLREVRSPACWDVEN